MAHGPGADSLAQIVEELPQGGGMQIIELAGAERAGDVALDRFGVIGIGARRDFLPFLREPCVEGVGEGAVNLRGVVAAGHLQLTPPGKLLRLGERGVEVVRFPQLFDLAVNDLPTQVKADLVFVFPQLLDGCHDLKLEVAEDAVAPLDPLPFVAVFLADFPGPVPMPQQQALGHQGDQSGEFRLVFSFARRAEMTGRVPAMMSGFVESRQDKLRAA